MCTTFTLKLIFVCFPFDAQVTLKFRKDMRMQQNLPRTAH